MTSQTLRQALPTDIVASEPRRTLTDWAGIVLMCFALTAPWGGIRVGPIMLCDWFLAAALPLLLLETLAGKIRIRVPAWLGFGGAVVGLVMIVQAVSPADPTYLMTRFVFGKRAYAPSDALLSGSFLGGAQWLVALLVLPIMVILVGQRDVRHLQRIALAWAIGAAISAVVASSDAAGLTGIGHSLLVEETGSTRQNGLAQHANNLGFSCMMAAPLAVYSITRYRRSGPGLWLLIALGAGVLLSGSRGSQSAFGMVVGLAFLASAQSRPVRRAIVLLTVALVLAWWQLPKLDFFAQFFRFGKASDSNEGRYELAHQAVLDFKTEPIWGIGLDNLMTAHSLYLQIPAAGGLVLVVGILAYLVGCLRTAWQVKRQYPLGLYLGLSVLGFMAAGIVENQVADRYMYVPCAGLAALAVVAHSLRSSASSDPELNAVDSDC